MSLNKAELIGNVGSDPRLKEFENGGCVCNLTIATTERGFTTKAGTKVEEKTEWHNVVFRNQLAKIIAQYVSKGDKIYVAGKIRTRQYEDKGVTKYVTEIYADSFEFMQGKSQQTQTQQPQATGDNFPFIVDDTPF